MEMEWAIPLSKVCLFWEVGIMFLLINGIEIPVKRRIPGEWESDSFFNQIFNFPEIILIHFCYI